jgi:hypothetical protein
MLQLDGVDLIFCVPLTLIYRHFWLEEHDHIDVVLLEFVGQQHWTLVSEFSIFFPVISDIVNGVGLDLEKHLDANFDASTFGERPLALDGTSKDALDLDGLLLFVDLFAEVLEKIEFLFSDIHSSVYIIKQILFQCPLLAQGNFVISVWNLFDSSKNDSLNHSKPKAEAVSILLVERRPCHFFNSLSQPLILCEQLHAKSRKLAPVLISSSKSLRNRVLTAVVLESLSILIAVLHILGQYSLYLSFFNSFILPFCNLISNILAICTWFIG